VRASKAESGDGIRRVEPLQRLAPQPAAVKTATNFVLVLWATYDPSVEFPKASLRTTEPHSRLLARLRSAPEQVRSVSGDA
jgi:hypothetical protein